MADALFAAPVDDLTSSGCERIAVSLGLDAGAYEACLADPATTARVEADKGEFEKAATKHDGLPLMWVGDTKLMGLQEPSAIRRAVERAIAHAGT
jgi:predicted DsbA family dithiol-disulfide isomerase